MTREFSKVRENFPEQIMSKWSNTNHIYGTTETYSQRLRAECEAGVLWELHKLLLGLNMNMRQRC